MKYKILKPFVSSSRNLTIGTEADWDKNVGVSLQNDILITIEELIRQGFIKEVKEPSKPKWKVGDYVVNTCTNSFIKIFSVSESNNPRIYNESGNYYYITESDLRDPTPEELSLYFR